MYTCKKRYCINSPFNSVLIPLLIPQRNFFLRYNTNILSIIKSLDYSKSHRYDNLSIKMIKICSESVCYTLENYV